VERTDFAIGAGGLGFVHGAAVTLALLSGVDGPEVLLATVLRAPWRVGTVALAACGAILTRSKRRAGAFLALEAGFAASTLSLFVYLKWIAPDAQNGFWLLSFPVVQYGVLLVLGALAETFRGFARQPPANGDPDQR